MTVLEILDAQKPLYPYAAPGASCIPVQPKPVVW